MKLLRPLYESWLFKATQSGLPGWQRSLLDRALRNDEALRCLAFELAEFNAGPAPAGEQAPDLGPRLRARIAAETGPLVERPLFPSGWVPAGAIAVLLITGWVALSVKPSADPQRGESSAQASPPIEALAAPESIAKPMSPSASALSPTAKTFLLPTPPTR